MRTVSPNFRYGILGSPCSMVSMVRTSAMQVEPCAGSRLEIVPEPMMVPAPRGTCPGGVGDQLTKIEIHIDSGIGVAEHFAVGCRCDATEQLAAIPIVLRALRVLPQPARMPSGVSTGKSQSSCQVRPGSSSGERRHSPAGRVRYGSGASSAETPIGTSSVITATSASRSIPQSSSITGMSSQAPNKISEPP